MSYPASTLTLARALASIDGHANKMKTRADNLRAASAAGDTQRRLYVDVLHQIATVLDAWDAAIAVPGLVAYARAEKNNQTLDVVAEFNAMRAALIALRDEVFGSLPVNGGGVVEYAVTVDGDRVPLVFTPAQTANFRTAAAAFIASVD